jgi:hypothetical protein
VFIAVGVTSGDGRSIYPNVNFGSAEVFAMGVNIGIECFEGTLHMGYHQMSYFESDVAVGQVY